MRRVIGALACAAAFAAATGEASAETTRGQWVIVDGAGASDALMTLNPPMNQYLARGERRLHAAPAGHRIDAPQWSPDGNRIAFAERSGGGSRVLVVELASGAVTEVAAGAAAPSWSPDGTRVAFARGGGLFTRLLDGGGEQPLPIDGTGVRDLAWSPDGELLALWVGDRIDLVTADGSIRETVGGYAAGGAAWSADSSSLAYSRGLAGSPRTVLYEIDLDMGVEGELPSARGAAGTDLEPEYAPTGTTLIFSDRNPSPSIGVLLFDGLLVAGMGNGVVPSEVDWQPCVTGVTTSCTSTTPPLPLPKVSCPAPAPLTAVAGRRIGVAVNCNGGRALEIVEPPAHGTLSIVRLMGFAYTPSSTYSGPDSFAYRVGNSDVHRVSITVLPKPLRPAAPKLTVSGRPRLDRRGWLTLRGSCDRACTVRLRVRVKLHTGRTVDGRAASASAPNGGALRVRLTRGRVPPRRRVVSVRVIGRLVGADGRERAFSLSVARRAAAAR